jgi:phosphate transport system substrate-binding protein
VSKQKLIAASVAMLMLGGASVAEARTQIRQVGSTTVLPFSKAVAEQFVRTNPKFQPPVIEGTGTGGGMKLFCAGVGEQFPDIENASRRIKASEIKSCADHGVTQIAELQVGLDGIAFGTSKKSQAFPLTTTDIYKAIAATPYGKPNTAKTWKDVNPKLPAVPIIVYGPSSISGTRDALGELIMTSGCKTNAATAALEKTDGDKFKLMCTKVREDGPYVETGDNPNLIVQKLEANPGTVGIFGYSYVEENSDRLVALTVNGVAPSQETVSNFKYPGSRPLYVYVKIQHARAVPGIKEYLAEYTKPSTFGPGGYLARLGLIPAPTAVRAASQATAAALTPMDVSTIK